MKIAIIALVVSLAALGLAGFATFTALNEESAPLPPVVEAGWSEAECADASNTMGQGPERNCRLLGEGCDAYFTMLRAIADNCP